MDIVVRYVYNHVSTMVLFFISIFNLSRFRLMFSCRFSQPLNVSQNFTLLCLLLFLLFFFFFNPKMTQEQEERPMIDDLTLDLYHTYCGMNDRRELERHLMSIKKQLPAVSSNSNNNNETYKVNASYLYI